MRHIEWFKIVQRLTGVAAGSIALAVCASGAADASYGPPPPPAPQPGSYYCVVTSVTVGRAGGDIGPVHLGGLTAWLRVRHDTFAGPAQVTITDPYLHSRDCPGRPLGDAGFRGYRALGGLGILVQRGGSVYRGDFPKPLGLRLTSRSITRSAIVVLWNGTRFLRDSGAVVRSGVARVQVAANSDLAVLLPVPAGHKSSPAT
jgi:hypothetical protein